MNRKDSRTADRLVDEARKHVGYRAHPGRKSGYQINRYNGEPWNGSFIQKVVDSALETSEVAFYSTVTALGFYARANRLYAKPRRGDIVFYNFASDPHHMFEQPHIGIVTEVKPNGVFRAIEGETGPGVPQGSQLVDGVFERERHVADAIGFARVRRRKTVTATETVETVRMSYLTSNPKTKARAVDKIQSALNRVTGKKFNRGKFDRKTKSTFGAYSRERGLVMNRGEMSYEALTRLAEETGMLEIEP